MKWFSRLAVVAAVLNFLLMIRSTMIEDRLEVLYGSATIEAVSGNGQILVIASRVGEYRTSQRWFPVVWHPQQRLSMRPSYDAAFGYAVGAGSRWSGSCASRGLAGPGCVRKRP